MKKQTQKIVISALLTAIICVATMIIKIPSPFKGYLNLGDCVVLFAGWMLSPVYGFVVAGLGSALADLFSGYALYAPATFIIKGLMALIAYSLFRVMGKKISNFPKRIISGIAAELVMILGYFLFEGFMYGFGPSVVNIPANAVQGLAGLILGILLTKALEKSKVNFENLK